MKLKYWIPLLVAVASIYLLIYQVLLPTNVVLAKGDAGNGTIAGVEIVDKKKSEIKTQIASEIVKWKEKDIEVEGSTATMTISSDLIHFDIDKTVDHYIAASSATWYKFWSKKKDVQIPMEVTVEEEVQEQLKEASFFYVDETIEAIKEHAQFLKEGAVQAEEVPLSKEDMKRVSFEIQEVVVDGHGISQVVDMLDEITIAGGETFSFLERLEEMNSFYSDETADFVASVLYSVVLQSEMDIQERHSQNVLPPYLEPGIEVKVNERRNQDFSFVNRTNRPYVIDATLQDGRLKVELYSFPSAYEVAVDVRQREVIKPRTIYRLTSSLAAGRERVLEQGEAGLHVNVYKRVTEMAGSYEEDILVSQDFYPPKHKVVLVSSLEPQTTTPSDGNSSSTDASSDQRGEEDEKQGETNRDGNKEDQPNGHENENPNANQNTNQNQDDSQEEELIYDKGGNLIKPGADEMGGYQLK